MTTQPARLLVVSHVVHYRHEGRLHAYAAYAREIDIWADLFPQVVIASPCRDETPPGDCAPLRRSNISILPQPETGGETLGAKLKQMMLVPYMVVRLVGAMRSADAIHVRGPGNLGLLGTLLGPLCSRYLVAKYAGNWAGYPEEPVSLRLQRWLLRSRWWRGPVTVYGEWPGMPQHVVSFFTSVMTDEQVARARAVASARNGANPFRVLYVGRLAPNKNVDVLLQAIAQLVERGKTVECIVIGDGPERTALESQATALGLESAVRFLGALSFDEVQQWYERGNVLVLASDAEGWPKAVAEAMAYGLVCVASDRGFTPRMLSEGKGILVQPRDLPGLTAVLARLSESPEECRAIGKRAAEWSQRYSIEGLGRALRQLLADRWNVTLAPAAPRPPVAKEPG